MGESLTSAKRLEAALRHGKALELRMAGMRYEQIAEALGYTTRQGALYAVKKALARTLQESSDDMRSLVTERLTKILSVFWTGVLLGDKKAAAICFQAIQQLRALHGLDAPTRIILQDEAQKLAEELGLDPKEMVALAEEIVRKAP